MPAIRVRRIGRTSFRRSTSCRPLDWKMVVYCVGSLGSLMKRNTCVISSAWWPALRRSISRGVDRIAVVFRMAGGNLQGPAARRNAILLDHDEPAVVEHRRHREPVAVFLVDDKRGKLPRSRGRSTGFSAWKRRVSRTVARDSSWKGERRPRIGLTVDFQWRGKFSWRRTSRRAMRRAGARRWQCCDESEGAAAVRGSARLH